VHCLPGFFGALCEDRIGSGTAGLGQLSERYGTD
jgi:hypothetical protein